MYSCMLLPYNRGRYEIKHVITRELEFAGDNMLSPASVGIYTLYFPVLSPGNSTKYGINKGYLMAGKRYGFYLEE